VAEGFTFAACLAVHYALCSACKGVAQFGVLPRVIISCAFLPFIHDSLAYRLRGGCVDSRALAVGVA